MPRTAFSDRTSDGAEVVYIRFHSACIGTSHSFGAIAVVGSPCCRSTVDCSALVVDDINQLDAHGTRSPSLHDARRTPQRCQTTKLPGTFMQGMFVTVYRRLRMAHHAIGKWRGRSMDWHYGS